MFRKREPVQRVQSAVGQVHLINSLEAGVVEGGLGQGGGGTSGQRGPSGRVLCTFGHRKALQESMLKASVQAGGPLGSS